MINSDVVRIRTGIVRKLMDRVNLCALRSFGDIMRIDDGNGDTGD